MSSDVTHSKDFNRIHDLDLDDFNLAKSSNAKVGRDNISKTAQAVIHHLQSPDQEIDQDRIAHFISNVDKINNQFKEENLGTPFATSLVALNTLFNLRQQLPKDQQAVIKHPFVVKLSELSSGGEMEDEVKVATELYQFLKKCLNPALLAVQSGRELEALKPIVQQCSSLAQSFSQLDTKGVLAQQRKDMIQTWKLKSFQSKTFYRKMLSYHVGKIPTLGEAKTREQVTQGLIDSLQEFYGYVEQGLISTQEQIALYKGVLELQKDFQQYGDGKKLDPLLETLRKKCQIPETLAPEPKKKPVQKRESSKEQEPEEESVSKKRREKEAQTTAAQPKQEKPKKEETSSSQAPSTQERKEKIIESIQLKISKLDLSSPQLKERVQEIIGDLKRLKPLLGASSDISSIEEILQILINPQSLAITKAELRFMELLGKKYKWTEQQLDGYSQLKNRTIQNAQSDLIKELKKSASHFETLNSACKKSAEGLREKVLKNRLDLFVDNNALNSSIKPQFILNFPSLVIAFETFTTTIVEKELESKWSQLLSVYDSATKNQFSKLLANYSYLDPRRDFPVFVDKFQKKFFDSLALTTFQSMDTKTLQADLVKKTEALKQEPGKFFENNYKRLYSKEHAWLFENINRIKLPYNQGDQDSTNLGTGVCYNNSLYRWEQLIQNPLIEDQEILLGSTGKTRFNQNLVKRYFQQAKEKTIPIEEAIKKLRETADTYGLKHYRTDPIHPQQGQDLHNHLVSQIEEWSKQGHQQVLLALREPEVPGGHAVTIQCDQKNNRYCLMDDNIGLVRFENMGELKKHLATYFRIFYPNFTILEFETYQQK